ncbi:MAG: hypothetical protein LBF62_07505 [Tannerellaceae bacterium]|jgi:hypothetical protein|nr:hypothetical protein [Tannerellaceae bacterium]
MNVLHYITKSRKGKEAQRIEREAMKDPFLADAIEGYDLVKNGNHAKRIENIRRHIRRKTQKRVTLARTGRIVAGIAASLLALVFVGINSYFRSSSFVSAPPPVSQSLENRGYTGHSLTVPEPTPLRDNTIKGEPKPATGERAYKEYISENLFLPAFDECSNTKGQVIVAFKVNAKGRPYDLDVKKSLCPTADLEAIRVVQQGPNWTSGDKTATVTIRF